MKKLRVWQEKERRAYVRTLFAGIADRYDRLNDIISLFLHHTWRRAGLRYANLKKGSSIIDLCTGTADFAIQAVQEIEGIRVTGVDFCREMLQVAKEKIDRLGLGERIDLIFAEVPPIPFSDNLFDCCTIGFGLRHVPIFDLLKEALRVLKPDGKVLTLDLSRPRASMIKALHWLYLRKIVPLLGLVFARNAEPYHYLSRSAELYLPDQEELKHLLLNVGFRDVKYFELLGGAIAIHIGVK